MYELTFFPKELDLILKEDLIPERVGLNRERVELFLERLTIFLRIHASGFGKVWQILVIFGKYQVSLPTFQKWIKPLRDKIN
ncbi:MAG: hypothetical protein KKD31_12780 [Bacteroidetes bacterium]|nr:hypothetical protein [Bacteroidota bacterium]